jgi:hypothetical protein
MPNTTSKSFTAIVADRDGNVHRTTRQNLTHLVVSWNWNRTRRVAGWTTKGQAGVDAIISKLVNADDVEVIELVQVPAVEAAADSIAADLDGAELPELPTEVVEEEAAAQAAFDAEVATIGRNVAKALHSPETLAKVQARLDAKAAAKAEAAELAAIEAQEAADIEREAAERQAQRDYVRATYGDQAAELLADGWTVDSAISHVTGTCDLELCTGDHGSEWALIVAVATKRPEAKVAALEAELARANQAVVEVQAKLAEAMREARDRLAAPSHLDAELAEPTWVEANDGALVLEDAAHRITARLTPMFHGGWLWLVIQGPEAGRRIANGTATDDTQAKAAAEAAVAELVAEAAR